MNRAAPLLFSVLLLAGCAAPAEPAPAPAPEIPAQETPAPIETPAQEVPETEDHVLATVTATVDGGIELTLAAVGKKAPDRDAWGIREVQVLHGDVFIQTVTVKGAIDAGGVDGIAPGYTDCWAPEETLAARDMNFDGSDDLDLFGWTCNNTIPHYYWLWDSRTRQFRYAFTLQGAEADPETEEVREEYRVGLIGEETPDPEGGYSHTNYHRYDETGALALIRREVIRAAGDGQYLDTYAVNGGEFILTGTELMDDGQ